MNGLAAYVGQAVRDNSESFSAVAWFLFNSPGYNHETSPICWETPIAILLYLDDKPVFGIGLEWYKKKLSIRQLHGVAGASIPAELSQLPKICVESVIEYATDMTLDEVRLYRAHTDMFYEEPFLGESTAQDREKEIKAIRRRMRRRYDGTARQLNFTMRKNWGEMVLKT